MNRLHYTKSRKQIYYECIISLILIFFAMGLVLGVGLTKALHVCETQAAETIETKEEIPVEGEQKQAIAFTEAGGENILKHLGKFKVTAYCACYDCCKKRPTDKGYGITASGVKAVQGVTIAAPKTISFGTQIIFDGHEYIVQDRGGAIKGNRIDVYFENHAEAKQFGVKYKDVYTY